MNVPFKTKLKMKRLLVFCYVLLCMGTSCKKEDKDAAGKSDNSNSNSSILVYDGLNREYVLYVPSSYDGNTPAPLLFNFHGFGGRASDYMNEADMRTLAEVETFILVYPQGSNLNGSSHWNACPTGGDNKSSADDFGFTEALLTEISSNYAIDAQRVYAAGYSNGGMMAYGLANHRSNLFAAVASVSGTMLDCPGTMTHPMPVLHMHGTSDAVLPYNGSTDYSAAQVVLDYWIDFNNTTTTPTVSNETNAGTSIEHYVYDQGDNDVSVEHYKYIDGNHVWFDNTYQGKTTGQLIWEFVSTYDLNGRR
jgi:polyhydroxybutyrate depolymerase